MSGGPQDVAGRIAPPPDVMYAFGLDDVPVPLTGGEGRSWRVDGVVLKPVAVPPAQLEWQAELFDSLQGAAEVRVPRSIRSRDGELDVNGWYASTLLEGSHVPGRWRDVIRAGEAFHRLTADLDRPAFLADRDDPYATADRVAWEEASSAEVPTTTALDRLRAAFHPLNTSSQVIHGDLTGNVLFHDSLPPAVIDLAAYFRPAQFATAVVVADALVWEGADQAFADEVLGRDPLLPQCLVRALVFRIVTGRLFRPDEPPADRDPYETAVDLAIRRATGEPAGEPG